ncbi:DUF2635 domain-containing protein [Insolitispirillum peregrinum]|uniref:DUF2635 domain-containing protein n=1 Tax=Insolitispirillum peregrinum TaxID=80876 RepID=UPI00360985F8
MSELLLIKPARAGEIVRDPVDGTPLAAAGDYKPRLSYWLRRLAAGDVIDLSSLAAQEPQE